MVRRERPLIQAKKGDEGDGGKRHGNFLGGRGETGAVEECAHLVVKVAEGSCQSRRTGSDHEVVSRAKVRQFLRGDRLESPSEAIALRRALGNALANRERATERVPAHRENAQEQKTPRDGRTAARHPSDLALAAKPKRAREHGALECEAPPPFAPPTGKDAPAPRAASASAESVTRAASTFIRLKCSFGHGVEGYVLRALCSVPNTPA